jgi:hypothetical protein
VGGGGRVDRDRLLENVSRCFAQMMFVDGFFNGDPHPGNLLVQQAGGGSGGGGGGGGGGVGSGGGHVPVLLDFGLSKRLEAPVRLALAKMLVAADVNDFNGLSESFSEMGFKFNRQVGCCVVWLCAGAASSCLQYLGPPSRAPSCLVAVKTVNHSVVRKTNPHAAPAATTACCTGAGASGVAGARAVFLP